MVVIPKETLQPSAGDNMPLESPPEPDPDIDCVSTGTVSPLTSENSYIESNDRPVSPLSGFSDDEYERCVILDWVRVFIEFSVPAVPT